MSKSSLNTSDALTWRKSSHSGQGNCVEVAKPQQGVAVRDSKDPMGPSLTFTAEAWSAFIADVSSKPFDGR
jgi:hypothetical protein